MRRMADEAARQPTFPVRYGKPLDVRRLKGDLLKDPETHLARIRRRRVLFEAPENLTKSCTSI
jgi:hypothetical protein